MAKCVCCGRTLNFIDSAAAEKMLPDRNDVVCAKCIDNIYSFITRYNYAKTKDDVESIKTGLIKVSGSFTQEGKDYILQLIDFKIQQVAEREGVKILPEEEKERLELYIDFPLTTGFNYEGYKIVKYLGIVSGEAVLGTGFLSEFKSSVSDFLGTESDAFGRKLKSVREAAFRRLRAESKKKGGNAVIGVDFKFFSFTANMIAAIATGTSVFIEKLENNLESTSE